MEFLPTRLPEVVLIKPRLYADERGYFLESWQELRFAEAGIRAHFVQDNHSHSRQFILRGLHYQVRNTQGKLVRVTHGSVYDVVVDMRRSSPQYGKWVGVELSADNHLALWVPPGFAHGYLTLSEDADFLYKCTDYYAPQHERAVRWNDPHIGVEWPLPEGVTPLLSPKDAVAPSFADAECFS
jgi:dTDP-4-dehydrorhamnose 3,5-epimerase